MGQGRGWAAGIPPCSPLPSEGCPHSKAPARSVRMKRKSSSLVGAVRSTDPAVRRTERMLRSPKSGTGGHVFLGEGFGKL